MKKSQERAALAFRRNALLAPGAVVHRHLHDESLHISGNTWASTLTGLQAPEEVKEISVPPDERTRAHNRQELAPFDKSSKQHERDTRRIVSSSRPDLAFDVTRELLPEKQVLGRQLRARPEHEPQQRQQVSEEGEHRSQHVW